MSISEKSELCSRLCELRLPLIMSADTVEYRELMYSQVEEDSGTLSIDELRVRVYELENPWSASDELDGMFPDGS